ncbi:hypothetical protein CS542_05780 [Pedobacter sp. IW39]|nr:hypothetical protein CS542_05780 [Pedobacter sp. IW39]
MKSYSLTCSPGFAVLFQVFYLHQPLFCHDLGCSLFQQDRAFSFHDATIACTMVPMGWVFGCPLLGYLTDKIGQRKPVLIGGAALMILSLLQLLFLPDLVPAYVSTFMLGIASGAAMIPTQLSKNLILIM